MSLPARGVFGERILALADEIARHSEAGDNLTCTYLTPAHHAAASLLLHWMRQAGLKAEIDATANVVGRLPSVMPGAKTLIIGSHYDTVRNAGKYDGRLGILTGLVVLEHLIRVGAELPFNVELIAFSEEEGVRFATPFIGSHAIVGKFDTAILERTDRAGLHLFEVMMEAGLDLKKIPSLARDPASLLGYLEVHIEQGPVLLREDLPVGIVSAIAGARRQVLTVTGQTGHAGTVPMLGRHDAAAAAAEIVLFVEQRCSRGDTLVGTVGQLNVPQGAINTIPGRCELSLDIRAGDNATRDSAIDDITAECAAIAARRGVTIESREVMNSAAAPCAPRLQLVFADAVKRAGYRAHTLLSGAGHDAMVFNGVCDIGMLFVRCGNGGISHSPLETVAASDADAGARVLLDALMHVG
ncbi:N-carbamoyl-L-amino acid hydrolase [Variibacter gotjawalensis]|uniref:N-carbamoyl-L-amino acid hydrolase n=1 Tax=Variibacter gotjawalensis TaxID=1333996 RepID=A0A0S3PT67_9BRAD|nr:allantoate amidohydrolase [Variibacter gotjawalensis]NIK49457.1 hydantoinase/carbamoylase family amidase [Variibacter gotjawalensis]RZS51309.1 hydantoinase/carbamoylase family amidase [Variibacter gotjawalensis]BAT59142.1 N-carbamoyl-L-amino acid hydrolase [Variibacter gotjawalensis]